jgi:hypothetical protein
MDGKADFEPGVESDKLVPVESGTDSGRDGRDSGEEGRSVMLDPPSGIAAALRPSAMPSRRKLGVLGFR